MSRSGEMGTGRCGSWFRLPDLHYSRLLYRSSYKPPDGFVDRDTGSERNPSLTVSVLCHWWLLSLQPRRGWCTHRRRRLDTGRRTSREREVGHDGIPVDRFALVVQGQHEPVLDQPDAGGGGARWVSNVPEEVARYFLERFRRSASRFNAFSPRANAASSIVCILPRIRRVGSPSHDSAVRTRVPAPCFSNW